MVNKQLECIRCFKFHKDDWSKKREWFIIFIFVSTGECKTK